MTPVEGKLFPLNQFQPTTVENDDKEDGKHSLGGSIQRVNKEMLHISFPTSQIIRFTQGVHSLLSHASLCSSVAHGDRWTLTAGLHGNKTQRYRTHYRSYPLPTAVSMATPRISARWLIEARDDSDWASAAQILARLESALSLSFLVSRALVICSHRKQRGMREERANHQTLIGTFWIMPFGIAMTKMSSKSL